MDLAVAVASELVIQRELGRGQFATPAEVVVSALRLLNSPEHWLRENREAISKRLELSFEQSRNGETYNPEQARQSLAETEQAANSHQSPSCLRARL